MAVSAAGSCACCGGRGWKFLTFRRSAQAVSGPAECTAQRMDRVMCVFCLGTGEAPAA